jgi:hypothetical protein
MAIATNPSVQASIRLLDSTLSGAAAAYDQSLNTFDDVEFGSVTVPAIIMTPRTNDAYLAGQMWYDGARWKLALEDDGATLDVGEELRPLFFNNTGAPIPDGTAVYMSGQHGDQITIAPATVDSAIASRAFLGLATADIPTGQLGPVCVFGQVTGVPRATIPFTSGSLYLNHVAGGVTTNASDVFVGRISRAYGNKIDIFVNPHYSLTSFDYTAITNSPWATQSDLQSDQGAFNGLSVRDPVMTLAVDGTGPYATITASGGGELQYWFGGELVNYGTQAVVRLTAGTTNAPALNYIVARETGGVANVTSYPYFPTSGVSRR